MAADKAIIILDASGSMWGQIDGKPKLEIARESLRTVLQSMPADLELGFMAYGHREKGNCDDIELIVPPAAGTANAITDCRRQSEIPRQDAADRRRQAGRRSAEIHRGQGDRHPHHRRARDLQRRPLRARQGTGGGGRRFHRPCRRLRPDGGRGQAGRLPRRKHRRQIHPGRRRSRAGGGAGRNRRRARAGARTGTRSAPAPEPEKPEFNFMPSVVLAEGGDPITDGNAWEIFKANADGTRGDNSPPSTATTRATSSRATMSIVAEDGRSQGRATGQDRGRAGLQAGLRAQRRHAHHPSARRARAPMSPTARLS